MRLHHALRVRRIPRTGSDHAEPCVGERGVYRGIELVQGWRGYLFTREGYAIALDAAVMVVANAVFVVWNPARLIPAAGVYEEDRVAREVGGREMKLREGLGAEEMTC